MPCIWYKQLRILILAHTKTIYFLHDNNLMKYNWKYLTCKNIHAKQASTKITLQKYRQKPATMSHKWLPPRSLKLSVLPAPAKKSKHWVILNNWICKQISQKSKVALWVTEPSNFVSRIKMPLSCARTVPRHLRQSVYLAENINVFPKHEH